MYSKDDVSYFIVDAHIALWEAGRRISATSMASSSSTASTTITATSRPNQRCGPTRSTSTRAASG